MKADERYIFFNELLFLAYCKRAVDNAILKGIQRKSKKAKKQLSMTGLTDSAIYAMGGLENSIHNIDEIAQVFNVHGIDVPVFHDGIAYGISYLLPKDREIILLYYFLELTDEHIAKIMDMKPSTVNYRRKLAQEKLRSFLEGREWN